MKLSVITINYNNRDGLKKTIESVVNQTYKDFEYIIIDGGSTDGSVEVLKEYSDKIDYWVSEPDKGIYNAMNKGIDIAKGEYVMNKKIKSDLMLFLTAFIWGSSFIAQSKGADVLGPFTFNAFRYTLAVISLLPVIYFLSNKKKSNSQPILTVAKNFFCINLPF